MNIKRALFLTILLAALFTFSACITEGRNKQSVATAKSRGKKVFFTGHSFFILGGYMAKKVDLIAKAAVKEDKSP